MYYVLLFQLTLMQSLAPTLHILFPRSLVWFTYCSGMRSRSRPS
jgi:hypothetical protein